MEVVYWMCLCLIVGGFLALWPDDTWEFAVDGHVVDVREHLYFTRVIVDGEAVPKRRSRTAPGLVEYEARVDGHPLLLRIEKGSPPRCRAWTPEEQVFDSLTRAVARVEGLAPPPPVPADPRAAAVRELVANLAGAEDPEVIALSRSLEQRALDLLGRIRRSQAASTLHAKLGGAAEADRLRRSLEAELALVLVDLKDLHVAVLSTPSRRTVDLA